MISRDRIIVQAREDAKAALGNARQTQQIAARPSAMRRAIVISQSDGWYTIGILGADSATVDTIPGVRVQGSGSFDIGDQVLAVYIGDRPIPYIMGAGGSGSDAVTANITGYIRFFSS